MLLPLERANRHGDGHPSRSTLVCLLQSFQAHADPHVFFKESVYTREIGGLQELSIHC